MVVEIQDGGVLCVCVDLTGKGYEVTSCSNGNILYLNMGLGYTGVCICQNSTRVIFNIFEHQYM